MNRLITITLLLPLACSSDDTSASPGSTGDTATMTDPTVASATTMSTSETDTTTDGPTTEPTTTSTTSTTDPPECVNDDGCTATPDTPLCSAQQTCVDCQSVADTPMDRDAACAELNSAFPLCVDAQCVECSQMNDQLCDMADLLCDTTANECVQCTRHSDCGSERLACHLDGPDVGTCFNSDDDTYIQADNATELQNAFAAIQPDQDVVIELTGTNYAISTTLTLSDNAEVAIIGNGTQRISGDLPRLVEVSSTGGHLYVESTTLGSNDGGSIIDCAGQSLWLDNSTIEGANTIGLDISAGCSATLRESVVEGNDAAGIRVDGAGASTVLANTFLAGSVNEIALDISDGSASVLYSTIGANFGTTNAIRCTGNGSATVRNSIVVSRSGDPEISCGNLTISESSTEADQGGTNEAVGMVQDAWFADYDAGDFHLEMGHPFSEVAIWSNGDPLIDIDGQQRVAMDGEVELPGADLIP